MFRNSTSPWMIDAVDLDGNERINPRSDKVDMGAYEYRTPGVLLEIR